MLKRLANRATTLREERGSALVLTLMVMTIMTVLGISFLVIADTENQISVTDRDGRQVLYVALSGTKVVESWFNVPDPAYNPFVPTRVDCDLTLRVGDSDYDGVNDIDVPTNGTGQQYRGGTAAGTYRLFDKPYRGATRDTFWGSFDAPDILISNDKDVDGEFLDRLSKLFNTEDHPSLEGVVLTEIRIYGPPVDNDLERRFGICTLSVSAAKVHQRGDYRRLVSERTVTVVLQELPFPAPGAAIESAAPVDVSGNFGVFWGGTYTESDMALQAGSNFPGPGIPRENTSRWRYANFAPGAPDLDEATPGTQNVLTQLLDDGTGVPWEFHDAWVNFRADGLIAEAPNANDQPWPYDVGTGLDDDRSIFFQNQTYVFPEIDYDFWKRYAQMRARNASYFKATGSDSNGPYFAKNGIGASYHFGHWANTVHWNVDPGVFFFDTANNLNPQNGGPGVLTNAIKLNSGEIDSDNGDFIAEGFVITMADAVDTSGLSGHTVTTTVNMPAEPFLDTGIDIDNDGFIGTTYEEVETIGNNVWDFAYEDSTASDGSFYDDIYGTADFEAFEASHQVPDLTIPDSDHDPRIWSDIVHEPFLNLAYPPENNVALTDLFVDYDYELTIQRTLGGDRDNDGVEDVMTSLRDVKGARVNLDIALNGVWYNEGSYDGSGNLPAFGSILMKGGFISTGSPEIYFNEGLTRGDWPPPEMKIPRVYASHVDTGN